ncbi:hypothetical protein [uncultured Dokdonia sp.]|mgnify:FL=1|uniref:hypothetical protein n=1 Tax=uncultured Dokdonia sp. TaxID=575653 RepID=UPI002619A4ED|nr:hypothetical protein [uncultured Dokdonia sp.]
MNFEDLFNDLKEEIITEAKEKFGEQGKDIIVDMEKYLAHSKEKLKKWALLFAEGNIDKEELAWLLQSQKDLLVLKTLQNAGVSKISIGHFKNNVIDSLFLKILELAN